MRDQSSFTPILFLRHTSTTGVCCVYIKNTYTYVKAQIYAYKFPRETFSDSRCHVMNIVFRRWKKYGHRY